MPVLKIEVGKSYFNGRRELATITSEMVINGESKFENDISPWLCNREGKFHTTPSSDDFVCEVIDGRPVLQLEVGGDYINASQQSVKIVAYDPETTHFESAEGHFYSSTGTFLDREDAELDLAAEPIGELDLSKYPTYDEL